MSYRKIAVVLGVLLPALALSLPAQAADKVRAGTAVAQVFTFSMLDIGTEKGIFQKHNIELEIQAMRGDAQLQQGMTAGSIDFALGSGPGLAFMAKGVPAKGIAAFAHQPHNLSLAVLPTSPIKGADDLKGKKLAITTPGSLTDWLVRETSRQKGWGPEGIIGVPLGAPPSAIAAMKTNQVDGALLATELSRALEAKNEGKMLFTFGNIVPDFHTHILFARNGMLENKDLTRRFVNAFFESIRFMRANKDETVRIASKSMRLDPPIVARAYDDEMPMLSDDGVFQPKAMAVLARSYVELGILPTEPDMKTLINTDYVPPNK